MALSANLNRVYGSGVEPIYNTLEVKAGVVIYIGAALTISVATTAGYVRPLNASTPDVVFVGFAMEYVASQATDGAKTVRVMSRGIVCNLPVSGTLARTDQQVTGVYGTDDTTFKDTSTGGIQIGKIWRFISSTNADVYFEAGAIASR